ncbi:hypothetical protein AGABI1DRAFT_112836 [Agaricus bisporus var. burnettii JB137-S8]|uniref:Uncharacterized protein n=1 Tax=Agaricus bisporus var. burnettii (strain JB137-S8 / ATCC MYA-4627 / FGSC 10392) TaxID=597362 RepID=K5Y096_AGABU|nr:uncharacterized protein AGABI1DRAFT_112836 [Agaricus bisporus var. burnettii JB137-S8]EKM81145.1 hypothetical protein AGABI1DRAFT_112836 [Agaricus bisporus var. burnettii JB137-S8]
MQSEVDLCSLLQTMNIGDALKNPSGTTGLAFDGHGAQDDIMDEGNYHSDGGSDCSNSTSGASRVNNVTIGVGGINEMTMNPPLPQVRDEVYGCAYLQMIREQLNNYPTTGGEYLDAIFTHREIFNAYPVAHRNCARAFSDLAYSIEQRAWRADRDADTDAVTAFRHEAWMIASTSPGNITGKVQVAGSDHRSKFGCFMPPMY